MKNLIPRHISPHSSNFNTRQICTFDIITFDYDDRFFSSRGYRAIYYVQRHHQSLMQIHSVDREIIGLTPKLRNVRVLGMAGMHGTTNPENRFLTSSAMLERNRAYRHVHNYKL